MESKKMYKYAIAAVVIAAVIIGASIYTSPLLNQTATQTGGQGGETAQGNFLVMITDPPDVPPMTTQLNVTYTDVSLHVTYSGGTTGNIAVPASGSVDLMSLINATKTIGSTTLQSGTTINYATFTITGVEARINGTVVKPTILSNQLTASVGDGKVGGGLNGILFDFTPTLMQIRSRDASGADVNYYVLVPGVTAMIRPKVDEGLRKIGPITRLGMNDRNTLITIASRAARNVTVSSASLSYVGNVTSLSITLENSGKTNATLFGLILGGRFNYSLPKGFMQPMGGQQGQGGNTPGSRVPRGGFGGQGGNGAGRGIVPMFNTPLLFILHGDTLIPMTGANIMDARTSFITLKPGESITLTFSGVLHTRPFMRGGGQEIAITPVAGDVYNLRINGMYVRTSTVTATKG